MGKAGKLKFGSHQKAKARSSVTLPGAGWDMGPNTAAQNAGKVIEDGGSWNPETGERINPNGIRRARRVDMLEIFYKRGWLDARQFNAAEKLRNAWEGTMRSPSPNVGAKVDSSPKPDHAVTIQIDQMTDFIWLMGKVVKADKGIIGHCVLDRNSPGTMPEYRNGRSQTGMVELRAALNRFAAAIEKTRN